MNAAFALFADAAATPQELIDDLRLLEAPRPWTDYAWLLAAALLAMGGVAWWLRRRRRLATKQADNDTLAMPEDALAALARLFALIEEERARPYGIESSAIIRRYLEARFALAAPQRSTEEFLREAQNSPRLTRESQALLSEFLRWCDVLKFAQASATRDELQNLHEAAEHFVRETLPAPFTVTPA